MKNSSPINIITPDYVNQLKAEADRIAEDPEAMLALVDLIFGFQESHLPPS